MFQAWRDLNRTTDAALTARPRPPITARSTSLAAIGLTVS
jgi:hypothetical protein